MEASFHPYIISFCWIGFFLMLGTYLRAKIKLFQKMLFPASLIGGIIGFIALNNGLVGLPTTNGWQSIEPEVFSMIVFHLFAFGFVGIGLLESPQTNNESKTSLLRGGLWFACIFSLLWALQSLAGFEIFSFFKNYLGFDVNPTNGYLIGVKGAGQAQAYGTMWELNHQVAYSISAALGFAAIGFLVAGLVGVPFINYGIKNGWASQSTSELSQALRTGIMGKDSQESCANATTHPANIDSFSFHLGLMFFLYGITYIIAFMWTMKMPTEFKPLGFGLCFIWATFVGMYAKKIIIKRKKQHLLDQETIRRLTGITVDFMICAVFLGIQLGDITNIIAPFMTTAILNIFIVLLVCIFCGRRTKEYGFERMVTLFGTCTGSAASGLLLLRIVDSNFKTPVAVELALMSAFTFILNFPLGWAAPFAPIEGFPYKYILLAYVITMPLVLVYKKLIQIKKVF